MNIESLPDSVRTIETTPSINRYARGWHCLGLANKFKDGKPHSIEAFGTKLVVFQGKEDGELKVLNAFCPHMGADLGQGFILGNSVVCPFHDWRWAGDGRCVGIPYARRVPPRARTRAWISQEINQQLAIWHDPEGNPPPADVVIPKLEGAYSDDWSDWAWSDEIVETHPRELIDNLVDMAHFFYVHGCRRAFMPEYFCNVFEGQVATQYAELGLTDAKSTYPRNKPFAGTADQIAGHTRSESSWNGPAYSIDHYYTKYDGGHMQSVLFLGILPIDPGKFQLSLAVLTKKDPDLNDEQNQARHQQNFEALRDGTLQDVHIWKTKARIENPLLCDGDGPVYQVRRWYEQFYVDVADIKPEMIAHFEHELDTAPALAAVAEVMAELATAERGDA